MRNINVHMGDGFLRLEPEIPESLKKKLTFWHRSIIYDERTHKRATTGSYKALYTEEVVLNAQNQLIHQVYTMPGFASRIAKLLQEEGYAVSYIDNRTPPPPYDLEKAMVGLREYQLETLYNAVVSGGGIISAPCGFGKTRIIKAIIHAFPRDQLIYRNTPLSVVVAADMDICRKNYNDIVDLFGKEREVGLVMTGEKTYSDDIQVITFDSLHKINPMDIGLLLVDEVHTAGTGKRTDMIMAAAKALKWGVSATPTGRFDGGDLVTEGLFGPIVYSSTYAEGITNGALVPIKVCWVKAPEPVIGVEAYNRYKTRLGKYNNGVEKNKDFSKEIVRLMQAIPDKYQTLCIMPHLQQMNELCAIDRDIKIVHGEQSADKLKENRYHDLYPISKKDRKDLYDQMSDGTIRKMLSTYVYKQGVDFPQLTVMICAGGGGSEIIAGQIPGRASRAGLEGKDCAYIVDFIHEWDTYEKNGKVGAGPILKDDKSRSKVYKQLGFEQLTFDTIDDLPFLDV